MASSSELLDIGALQQPYLLKHEYIVNKVNQNTFGGLFKSKKTKWIVDLYNRTIVYLSTAGSLRHEFQGSLVTSVEPDFTNQLQLTIGFKDLSHGSKEQLYVLQFESPQHREAFHESIRAMQDIPLWCPPLCKAGQPQSTITLQVCCGTVMSSLGDP